MSSVFFFVVFVLFMAFSRYGLVKFGLAEDKPEYSNFSWFSMLFGCGMGVGLIFWAVAEPVYHYMSGPTYAGKPESAQAAEWSMAISFFHWGISAWAVYAVVGIAMGIIIHKKRLPTLISSCFYSILGDRIYGPVGKFIDIFTLVATFFGMCTSIGLGTMQLTAGLHWNWSLIPIDNTTNSIVLVIVTAGYLASATLPIEKGIRIGSNASMIATLCIMVYLTIVGPTIFIFNNFFNAIGIYLQNFPTMSLWLDPVAKTGWLKSWTIFYWAWWIAWAPFVGIFIAKISRGRSVREFVLAALLAPTIFSMIFFSIFGSSAISQQLDKATGGALYKAIQADVSSAIFVMFERYPLSGVVGIVLLFVIYTFFVVSADSCTIVLGMLSSGGNEEPKTTLKILWGVAMAVAAGVLLAMNGLAALQTASIVAALVFTVIMLFLAYATLRMVRADYVDELETK
ncbi:MAG: hypothetical protein ACD_75C02641G0002 [uncultured bacterium]|nr:MAG: hypothetical protein ACD_75C02641G0002 [uncultured bacterium]